MSKSHPYIYKTITNTIPGINQAVNESNESNESVKKVKTIPVKRKIIKKLIFNNYLSAYNHAMKHGIKRKIVKTGVYKYEL